MRTSRSHTTARWGAALALAGAATFAPCAVAPAMAQDGICQTSGGYVDPFYPGPGSSSSYDRNFANGAPVNASLISGDYVPQGLAWWPNWRGTGTDALLITAYHDGNHDKDPDGNSAIFGLEMRGSSYVQGLGSVPIASGHVGGVAVVGSWVYVANGSSIRRYAASTVRTRLAGASGGTALASTDQAVGRTASFLGKSAGTGVWVGTHDTTAESRMERWDQLSTGALSRSGVVRPVPAKTQGMAETSTHFFFSTSYGRTDRSNIWVTGKGLPTSSSDVIVDSNSYCFRAPSMSEGLAIGGGQVWLGYESGSKTYASTARNPIVHVHRTTTSYLDSRPLDIDSD